MTTSPGKLVPKTTVTLSSSFQGYDSSRPPSPAPSPWPCSTLSLTVALGRLLEPASQLRGFREFYGLAWESMGRCSCAPENQFISVLSEPHPLVNWRSSVCVRLECDLGFSTEDKLTEAISYGILLPRNKRLSLDGQKRRFAEWWSIIFP